MTRSSTQKQKRPVPGEDHPAGHEFTALTNRFDSISGSGGDTTVCPVGRHVRRLVEQPEPLPFVTGLTEVF
jgi:hypothetical protein